MLYLRTIAGQCKITRMLFPEAAMCSNRSVTEITVARDAAARGISELPSQGVAPKVILGVVGWMIRITHICDCDHTIHFGILPKSRQMRGSLKKKLRSV